MFRLRNCSPIVALLLACLAVLGTPLLARADFAVQVYEDGILQYNSHYGVGGDTNIGVRQNKFSSMLIPDDDGNLNNLVFGGSTQYFSITNGSASSNNPGTPGGANLNLASSGGTVSTTFGNAGGTHTLKIVTSQNGWTAPAGGPLTLTSSAGGTVSYVNGSTVGAKESVIANYQGFLDNTNTLFGQPAVGSTPAQMASAELTQPGTSPLVFTPATLSNQVPGGVPFSMTDVTTITFTLGAGSGQDSATISGTTVASVPAPAGVALVFAGLPVLGLGTWLRRRQVRVAAV